MSFISWQDDYSIGIESMDQEHRDMIELVDRLYESVVMGAGPDELLSCFDELKKSVRHHIASEEGLMLLRDYPGYAGHHREHQRLYGKLMEYRDGLAVSTENALVVMEFARAWLIGHIMVEDRRYGDFLTGNAILDGLKEECGIASAPVD